MIEWVWERASGMACLSEVVVATDSAEVVAVCEGVGARAVLTDPGHPSGTDRVAEVAAREGFSSWEVVVNLQGDEPLMEAEPVALLMVTKASARLMPSLALSPVGET